MSIELARRILSAADDDRLDLIVEHADARYRGIAPASIAGSDDAGPALSPQRQD